MPLRLYNTLTNKEEEFVPIQEGEVTMYTCGPTVYGRPHIGNYSSFLMADLLRRWLEKGHHLTVKHVKNITDVGHLVADADDGVDKVEKQAKEEFGEVTHESVLGIARKYEEQYVEDEKTLNMLEPAERPRATDFIEHMKEMINSLLESGNAYSTDDGIYFDVTSNLKTAYGSLSGNKVEDLQAGSRVKVNEQKKNTADFALWKFCVGHNENHALRWKSPGENNPEGFPGWHIECSAMSRSLLGDQIDIHTGGEDNIFPHHECEIAQSESVTGVSPFVNLWLHKRRVDIASTDSAQGAQKMSKSLGNVLLVSEVIAMGFSALDLRYYFLSVHYRTQLKFSEKGLEDAHKARRKIVEWMEEVKAEGVETLHGNVSREIQKFSDAMNADLNTPAALAVVFDAMTASRNENSLGSYRTFIELVRDTFGCFEPEEASIPNEIEALLDQREQARTAKNFELSDQLREQISVLGYEVRDVDGGQVAKKM